MKEDYEKGSILEDGMETIMRISQELYQCPDCFRKFNREPYQKPPAASSRCRSIIVPSEAKSIRFFTDESTG